MATVPTSNYGSISPSMQWKTADSDQFERADDTNTSIAVEGHDHTVGKGLAVGRLNITNSLVNKGDIFINGAIFTFRDAQVSPANHTVATLDAGNAFTGANTYTGSQDLSGITVANNFKVPVIAGAAPTAAGALAFNSTTAFVVYGNGTTTVTLNGAGPTGTLSGAAFGTTDPTNGFLCDGRAVSRTTYAALFSKISTAYGAGDGSTTFNIPDSRSRVLMGADNMGTSAGAASRTSSNNALGNTSGEDTHVLSSAEMPSHSHVEMATTSGGGANRDVQTVGGNNLEADTTASTEPTGGGGAHNNRQLNQVANLVIWF